MTGEPGDGGGAPPDLRYRPLKHRSRAPIVLGGVAALLLVAGGIWLATSRTSSTVSASANRSGSAVTTSPPTTASESGAVPTSAAATATTSVAPITTVASSPASASSGSVKAVVVSTGCESTCRVYRRDSPWDDLSQRGDSYHIHGDTVMVVCSADGQDVFDADSGRSSTTWYQIEGGWWMSAVYLLLDDANAVPAC